MRNTTFLVGILFLLLTTVAEAGGSGGINITGKITNANNAPVAGATVTLSSGPGAYGQVYTYTATTNASGNYQINNITWLYCLESACGDVGYQLYVSAVGYQNYVSAGFTINPLNPSNLQQNAQLVLLGTSFATLNLSGNATATFTSSPAGIDCTISSGSQTGTCSFGFNVPGTSLPLTLTANVPAGTIINWGVSGCNATATTCSQSLTQSAPLNWNISVAANSFALNLTGNGTATITSLDAGIDCLISSGSQTGICSEPVGSLQTLTLTASAPAGTTFSWGVSGCNATATTCSQSISPSAPLTWNIEVNPSPYLGWWTLDDASGTIANDSSGAGNNGTLVNNPTWTTGITGGALSFNGIDQEVNMGHLASTVTDNFTITAWVYPAELDKLMMAVMNGANDNGYGFGMGNARGEAGSELTGIAPGIGWISSGYTFPSANTWYFVVMESNAGKTSFYVNGALTATQKTQKYITPTTVTHIGGQAGIRYWSGEIADVRMYNRALSTSEVQNLYWQIVPPVGLTLNLNGTGVATFTSSPAGINCATTGVSQSGTCTADFSSGQNVTLTATNTVSSLSTFNWGVSGNTIVSGCTSTSTTCTITVAKDMPIWNIQVITPAHFCTGNNVQESYGCSGSVVGTKQDSSPVGWDSYCNNISAASCAMFEGNVTTCTNGSIISNGNTGSYAENC